MLPDAPRGPQFVAEENGRHARRGEQGRRRDEVGVAGAGRCAQVRGVVGAQQVHGASEGARRQVGGVGAQAVHDLPAAQAGERHGDPEPVRTGGGVGVDQPRPQRPGEAFVAISC